MLSADDAVSLVNDVFEEEALVLGGLVATGDLSDDAVWQLVRSLDVIRGRAFRRLEELDPEKQGLAPRAGSTRPHPAIVDFLDRLGKDPAAAIAAGVAR